ncbi:MAG: hypothetical protein RL277_207, partial [Planctomycetota bacterium]
IGIWIRSFSAYASSGSNLSRECDHFDRNELHLQWIYVYPLGDDHKRSVEWILRQL